MASLSTSSGPRGPSPGRPIEQLLVMHCLKEDSVLGREGFSVRAASPGASDRDTLDWAMRLDPYQLPLDMKSGMLLANQAPRRLAMVPGPSGQAALVHTAYLPEDTVGRNHSFISQVLLVPELSTIEAVAAWGASDWQTDEYPRGDTKSLPRLDDIPHGSLLDEATLAAFLSGAPAPADQSLARSVFPGRVESNPDARRRWVRAALHGFLLTVDANSPRTRVCILAEPGAVALLVYAIARLLPPQLVGTVPFSTYEPPDTSLRENKVARVIGSYARNGLIPSASDGLRRKGYVVDTFRDAYGPDLLVEASFPLEGLLNLAAEGDWAAVDELRDLWSRDPQLVQGATPASLAEAVRARPLVVALKAGTIGADGLIELRRNRFGEGLLRDPGRRRLVWEALRTVWARPGIRVEFSDLLREHLDDLLDEVRAMVQSGPAGPWREGWEVLKPLVPADRRAGDYASFLDLAGKGPAAAATALEDRIAMLREWAQLAPRDAAVPGRLYWLLRAPDASGFRALARSGLEPRHVGLAACLALAGSSGREHGPGLVQDLGDEPFQAMLAELASFSHKEAVFDHLRSSPDMIRALVERLLQSRAKVPPAQVEDILSGMRCDEAIGHGFWLQDKHLAGLLDRLESDSKLSRRLWAGLIARITAENFTSSGMAAEMETLAAARDKFPSSLTPEDRERLDGWTALRAHFAAPQKDPAPGTAARLRKACEAVGQSREILTREWFHKRVLTASGDLERKRRNETLGLVLLGFYETEDSAKHAARKLAGDVPDAEQRRLCEVDLRNAILSEGSGQEKGHGRKSLNQWKPYAAAFAAGCVLTLLLMLLLAPVLMVASGYASAWWQPKAVAKKDDPLAKMNRELENQVAASAKKLQAAAKRLADQDEEIVGLRGQLTNRTAEIEDLRDKAAKEDTELKQIRDSLHLAQGRKDEMPQGLAQSRTAKTDPPSAPADGEFITAKLQLNDLIHVKALHKEDISKARELANKLDRVQPRGNPGQPLSTSIRLLAGLGAQDVPEIASGKKNTPDPYKSDFAFFHSSSVSKSALATLSSRYFRACYAFETKGSQLEWKGTVPSKDEKNPKNQFSFLSSSASGDFALMRRSNGDRELLYIDCDRFYDHYFVKKNNDDMAGTFNAMVNGHPEALSISNGGRSYAALTQNDGGQHGVNIWPLDSERSAFSLDLGEFGKQITQGSMNSRIDFDPQAKSCTLWLKDKDSVLLYRLNEYALRLLPSLSDKNDFPEAGRSLIIAAIVKDSLCFRVFDGAGKRVVDADETTLQDRPAQLDGLKKQLANLWPPHELTKSEKSRAIAVVSSVLRYTPKLAPEVIPCAGPVVDSAYSFDGRRLAIATTSGVFLRALNDKGENPRPDENVPARPGKMISAVAFSPAGTYLAVGYDDGIVAIYDLRHNHQEILLFSHEGPVFKLGFSPDRRVLAVLSGTDRDKKKRSGVIRLWVTEKWEQDGNGVWKMSSNPSDWTRIPRLR